MLHNSSVVSLTKYDKYEVLICCHPEQAVKYTADALVIKDPFTVKWLRKDESVPLMYTV